ncbi:MAG: hypothetical protein GX808_07940 [Syntrophomonadaceae bacterium]|jgi:hypothetical protein|nr:hypothetical protein [Syntrophomonadaceae bacterium]
MNNYKVSPWLLEDYQMLVDYMEGNTIEKVLSLSDTHVILLMKDNVIIKFSHLEDELIFDIVLPPV